MQLESSTRFEYNAQGQLVAEEQDGQRIEYRYDVLGRLEQRTSASGVSRYRFDALGSLVELHSNGHVLQMQHNALGQETRRLIQGASLPQRAGLPGLALAQGYDSRQRLVSQQVQHPLMAGSAVVNAPTAPTLERHSQWDFTATIGSFYG